MAKPSFHFQNIKLWEIPTDQFKQLGLEGLLPLPPLTKEGARRETIEEMITSLLPMDALRAMLTRLVSKHFPDLASLASQKAMLISDPEVLRSTIDAFFAVKTTEEAKQLLS